MCDSQPTLEAIAAYQASPATQGRMEWLLEKTVRRDSV